MEVEESIDYCEDCGERVYNTPEWITDIVLCKSCYFERKNSEEE